MALTETQQNFELIKKSRKILIILKRDWTGDAISSSLALKRILKKLDKQVEVVCQDFNEPANLGFLGLSDIKNDIDSLQKFVVSIDTSSTSVGEFYYDNKQDKLNIYLSPKNGQFKKEDISASVANYEYDLIFVG